MLHYWTIAQFFNKFQRGEHFRLNGCRYYVSSIEREDGSGKKYNLKLRDEVSSKFIDGFISFGDTANENFYSLAHN